MKWTLPVLAVALLLGCSDDPDESAAGEEEEQLDGGEEPSTGDKDGGAKDAAKLDASKPADAARPPPSGPDASKPDASKPDAGGVVDAGGIDAGPSVGEGSGCEPSIKLMQVPGDPTKRGPWTIGAKTVELPIETAPGKFKVEIWYPAAPGSDAGKPKKTYDLRSFLKEGDRSKIPDEKATSDALNCDCYDGIPVDAAHGPYPVVFYVHGTAAMRVASAAQMQHWASRGFVVVAADHPGMYLADMLWAVPDLFGPMCLQQAAAGTQRDPQNVPRDLDVMVKALSEAQGELAFLAGKLDMKRLGMTGHSQGAGIAADQGMRPNVQISIPLAGRKPVLKGPDLKSTLFLGGMIDSLVTIDGQRMGYDGSPKPKRQVAISNAEHLVMTDLCGGKNVDGKDAVEVATQYGVCGISAAGLLWTCSDDYISQEKGTEIVNYATTAALEETLFCADRKQAWAELKTRYPEVAEFREEL